MSTLDDLMALADRYAEEHSPPLGEYLQRRAELRSALESALRSEYERGRVAERELHVLAETTQSLEPEKAAEPVAFLLRPIVQRNPERPLIRGIYAGPRTKEDYEFAALDGDEYVPIYASPPKREPLAGCSDLRDAKWLDPECCEAGACQSLRFKNKREPLTEREIKDICHMNGWDDSYQSMRFARAIERAHGIGDE